MLGAQVGGRSESREWEVSMKEKDQYFRANAGIVLLNEREEVLALERKKIPGAWQLPQGGIRTDEEPMEAAIRELSEETNFNASHVQLVGELPEWLAYELPAAARSEKTGRGQVQRWFFFRLIPNAPEVRLTDKAAEEVSAYKWTNLLSLAKEVVAFRRRTYERLASYVEVELPQTRQN
jgi:putative (di)nucleoside polyphosphate hydrolase